MYLVPVLPRHCSRFSPFLSDVPSPFFSRRDSIVTILSLPSSIQTHTFGPVSESSLKIGNVDERCPNCDKHKFPFQYHPEGRWARKGYLRTRWKLGGTPVDLINVHNFHDASNLVSVEAAPSIYCDYRRRALQYTLDRIQNDESNPALPFFIFGDFNFRLEGQKVLEKLSEGLKSHGDDDDDDGCSFKDNSDKVVLSLGRKEFSLLDKHEETFQQQWRDWTEFDQEKVLVSERVTEADISFPPTYPFEEDLEAGCRFTRTRCPAWCDRVLYSHPAASGVLDEDRLEYGVVGRSACMGDHKPVYLRCGILPERTSVHVPSYPRYRTTAAPALEKCPRVESPTYTDLLSNSTGGGGGVGGCTTYLEIRDVNAVKIFKETTV